MCDRRFKDVERLRSPERIALLEVKRVVDLCIEDIDVKSVLDIGTGSGLFAGAFVSRDIDVTGIDENLVMLESARGFVPEAKFRQAPAESIPFEDNSFDLIFMGLVLHEVDNQAAVLSETRRVANKRVAVLEWRYIVEEYGPPISLRLRQDQVERMAADAGFKSTKTIALTNMVLYFLDK